MDNKVIKKSHLVLVRHGESEWNQKGLWTGWFDIPLTEKGRIEAISAASTLTDITFDLFISSDLIRAVETMEIIRKHTGQTNTPVLKHAAYKERNYGIYAGKSKWDLKKVIGDEKFLKIRRSWDEPIPKGESLKQVYKRVVPHFIQNIIPKLTEGQNIIIVAHGNTNRALIKYIEGITDKEIAELEIATGEVMVYEFDSIGKILTKEKRFINKNKGKQ